MTGIEVLQALLDGKKLTIPDIEKPYEDSKESYYVQVVERVDQGIPDKYIVWLSSLGREVIINPSTWEYGNLVDASLFLRDDWKVIE